MDNSLDPALLQALEESAKQHQTKISSFLLSSSFSQQRKKYNLPKTAPEIKKNWEEMLKGGGEGGEVVQMNVFQQFHSDWAGLIQKYKAPSAICGLFFCFLFFVI